MRLIRFFVIFIATTLTPHAIGSQHPPQSFEPAIALDTPRPSYPRAEARAGAEGWVILNFMIGVDGRAFAPTVFNSSGREAFHTEALKALQRSRWEPARLDGIPVESNTFHTYRFRFSETQRAVSFAFRRRYDALMQFIDADDQANAQAVLDELNGREFLNNMEGALLNMASYLYHNKYGAGNAELMSYLNNALAYESYDLNRQGETRYLPDNLIESARHYLFMLQVNTRHYVEALNTYDISQQSGADMAAFSHIIEQIHGARTDDSSYGVAGRTDHNGQWGIFLFKPGLYIDNPGNGLSEFALRCRNKYQVFAFQQGSEYRIPESWGQCLLQVHGDADIEFRIEQFR